VDALTFANWFITIAPIWVVAMTLYQRMYASPTVRDARKAWFIAGLFEYPVMAFSGAALGMMSRVLFPGIDGELGVPMLLTGVLPAGLAGIVVASYFSAIMSTADSCLIASSGNVVSDVLQRSRWRIDGQRLQVRASQAATLLLGAGAVLIASRFTMVLDAILQAYAFLVAGQFVPTLGAYFWKRATPRAAFWGMLTGGGTTVALLLTGVPSPFGLDPSFWGILTSSAVFVPLSLGGPPARTPSDAPDRRGAAPNVDTVERLGSALVQHGPFSDRVYVMKLVAPDAGMVLRRVDTLAERHGYGKIVAKCSTEAVPELLERGYRVEAEVPRLFGPEEDGVFVGRFLDPDRAVEPRIERVREVLDRARASVAGGGPPPVGAMETASGEGGAAGAGEASAAAPALDVREAGPPDAEAIAACYGRVFESYPFPIDDPAHVLEAMRAGTRFFAVWNGADVVAASSMEDGGTPGTVEMTDFATLPEWRGRGLARRLLARMERAAALAGTRTAFTIARAVSFGMNITFGRRGYTYAGTLVNNTQIAGSIESMNVWYRHLDR
jgi:putative beta-lysine N-acetyltransferase